VDGAPLTPTEFANAVTAITGAFGDPTRRDIYLYARDRPDGVTATEAAEQFDLHPNVARHHLDKLASGGYLEISVERVEGATAGRPSKHYSTTDTATALELPVRRDDLLVSLLGRALALLPNEQAAQMAEEVGALIDLRAENTRLREERARLLHWQTVARRLDSENKALRDLLNFKPVPEPTFITARVIVDSGGAFANSLVLNAGSRAGVAKGQAVVTGDGLVGRIHGVGARSARVLLVTDLNSRIPALIESTNTKIRVLTRIAYGFKSPEALIALAMLALGGHRPALPGR